MSKHLVKEKISWSTNEKEFYAIKYAFKKFYHYLHGQFIIIYTDQQPLVNVNPSEEQQGSNLFCWSFYLSQFNHEIRYRPGKTNQNADALSRIPVTPDSLSINLISQGGLSKLEFINAQLNDDYCTFLRSAKRSIWDDKRIENVGNLLTLRGKIIVPVALKFRIMEQFHDHLLGGHLGFRKTSNRISRNMRPDI